MPAGISRVDNNIVVSVLVNPNTNVCHTRHDLPFHVVLDKDVKGVAFYQSDGIYMEGVLVMIDARTPDFSMPVDQVTVQGVVMTIARRQDGLLNNQA